MLPCAGRDWAEARHGPAREQRRGTTRAQTLNAWLRQLSCSRRHMTASPPAPGLPPSVPAGGGRDRSGPSSTGCLRCAALRCSGLRRAFARERSRGVRRDSRPVRLPVSTCRRLLPRAARWRVSSSHAKARKPHILVRADHTGPLHLVSRSLSTSHRIPRLHLDPTRFAVWRCSPRPSRAVARRCSLVHARPSPPLSTARFCSPA